MKRGINLDLVMKVHALAAAPPCQLSRWWLGCDACAKKHTCLSFPVNEALPLEPRSEVVMLVASHSLKMWKSRFVTQKPLTNKVPWLGYECRNMLLAGHFGDCAAAGERGEAGWGD